MSDRPGGPTPENNIYTMLLMVAAAYVVGATLFLAIKNQQLFGSWNPFSGV